MRVAVLGCTGSIGRQALEVVSGSGGRLEVHSLLCRSSTALLMEQASRFPGAVAAVSGEGALERCIEGADIVLNAITGSAGLAASMLCMAMDKPLALANKESLVIGGELLRGFISRGRVIPVDSEHSTIWRCLEGLSSRPLGITITASGGALRDMPAAEAAEAVPSQVLAHPTWDMGPRITVDSATLVNKAFEVIEARWLFPGIPVAAVLHPQSIVHSLVRLPDGSWSALLGAPDMRIPIQYALLHGEEPPVVASDTPLDWPSLAFGRIDPGRYPAFGLVCGAGEAGMTWPAAANAADEAAVEAFLAGRIRFGGIAHVISEVLGSHDPVPLTGAEVAESAGAAARRAAEAVLERMSC